MRTVIALVLLSGCASAGSGAATGSTRTSVLPMLSELPTDASKRDAVLDSASTAAGPEQRTGMTGKERQAETGAATAAAILGGMFSKTQNTTIGSVTVFDEQDVRARPVILAPLPSTDQTPPPADGEHKDLVPWIKLQPTDGH